MSLELLRWFGRGLPDSLGKGVLFRPHTDELFNLGVRPQFHCSLRSDNRLRVSLWIVDGNIVEDGVAIDPVITLGNTHIFTVWITGRAKPGLVIEPDGFSHQCVISLPMTNRIAIPSGIRIGGQRSPIGPDRPPLMFTLEELQNPARSVNKLE